MFDSVYRTDVWMIESRRSSRFSLKSLKQIGIFGQGRCEELQSDVPAKIDVFGFINHSHSAFTQLRRDAIVRDGSADHLLAPEQMIMKAGGLAIVVQHQRIKQ